MNCMPSVISIVVTDESVCDAKFAEDTGVELSYESVFKMTCLFASANRFLNDSGHDCVSETAYASLELIYDGDSPWKAFAVPASSGNKVINI